MLLQELRETALDRMTSKDPVLDTESLQVNLSNRHVLQREATLCHSKIRF